MKSISRRQFFKGSTGIAGAAALMPFAQAQQIPPHCQNVPTKWDFTADVVVVGAGACGMASAIRAADAGADILVVDTNYDIGGHAILSASSIALGGGTALQKKYGIKDDPETYFKDLTDWTVTETDGMPDYRFCDRELQHSLAYNGAAVFDFLKANGLPFEDEAPDNFQANHASGVSALRSHHVKWRNGVGAPSPSGTNGTSVMRPLDASARKRKNIRFLFNYHMDQIFREQPLAGRVIGIEAHYTPTILPGQDKPLVSWNKEGNVECSKPTITIKASKGIVIATGGNTGNVEFRRMFDPRLTKEFQCAGAEWSPQDGSGELAAMAIGAALWGTCNQAMNRNGALRRGAFIGSRTGYVAWKPQSPIWGKVKATGLFVGNWQDCIAVNQAGHRFYNEIAAAYPNGTCYGFYDKAGGYVRGDWRNPSKVQPKFKNYIDAACAINEGSTGPDWAAGPQWAIFDSDAIKREKWNITPQTGEEGYFFVADTLDELQDKLTQNPYQNYKMPKGRLAETVARYNSMVDKGVDEDFDKPKPKFKIEKGPFYAAWCTFNTHDTYAGLRVNGKNQVVDFKGEVIPGLYCGGESAGGLSQHGMGRCFTAGYIIGGEVVKG
ncbi:FAD-dependent oxidoreductase [Parasutterella excrementihominis]|uniref:FAD-dependent oxidoreductase n=1 Tax=Parasutterella excrementihominis TaxID=487175 RepID=UPI00248B10AB|nr:FAD-binding protein [Parasutterella excrementihominis]